ncbi:MAG: hypothetical protein IPJ13_20645 [Saprospiraceae bacterium]|nr:hypothetical protein [Saprospiraceae bacterium]
MKAEKLVGKKYYFQFGKPETVVFSFRFVTVVDKNALKAAASMSVILGNSLIPRINSEHLLL